jgi:2-keto-3-deoxy-L-rhamnonate aldolase RhmA
VTAATGADAIDWIGLDLEHGDLDLGDVIPLTRVAEGAGLDAATEIVAVDGVDGIFVGPYDLSRCHWGADPATTPS